MNVRGPAVLLLGLLLVAWGPQVGGNESGQATRLDAEYPRPNFSGDWQLNVKASDDPLEKLREAMQASRQPGGVGRGTGGGKGHGSGDSMAASGMGGSVAEFAAQLNPPQALHITHEDPMLLIGDANERPQRLFTDFRGGSVPVSGGLEQRVSVAGWEGKTLVVETSMLGKMLIEQYALDSGSGRLLVTTQAQVSTAPPVSYRTIYERVKPDALRP